MEVRVLGPFEVLVGDVTSGPHGDKRRGLLAMLVLAANQSVPVGDLIDGLWGSRPPPSATNLVQTYVSAWRKALEPTRDRRRAGRLTTVGAGYQLSLQTEELDLTRFRHAISVAAQQSGAGNQRAARDCIADALDLWRGAPLSDLSAVPFQAVAAQWLAELRLQAIEQWASACLACGSGRDAITTLRDERNRNPLRERLTELLMGALAQDNRQAEALAAYDGLRTVLVDELGADPSAAVREMHANVLSQAEGRQATTLSGHHGLPELTDSFIGREHHVRDVFGLLADHRLVTLIGTGGAGKTRLAVEVGKRVDHDDGGVVFVDAALVTAAGLIPDRLARGLGITPGPGQGVLEALSRSVGTQDLLVVIDNLEHLPGAADVVVELLRRGPGIRVLATSRTRLNARGEHVHPVPPLNIDAANTHSEAATLFLDRAVAADPSFSNDADSRAAVDAICRRLDGLPLAIELAASRVRTVPPAILAGHLDRAIDMLTTRTGERPERHRTLRATIRWSYDLLPNEIQATFPGRVDGRRGDDGHGMRRRDHSTRRTGDAARREPDRTRGPGGRNMAVPHAGNHPRFRCGSPFDER
jgi:DNA-binding SARP family transcriptional activator